MIELSGMKMFWSKKFSFMFNEVFVTILDYGLTIFIVLISSYSNGIVSIEF